MTNNGGAARSTSDTGDRAADAVDDVKDTAHDAADQAQDTAEDASRSTPFRVAARSGYAVNGLLHVVIGVVALRVATGNGGSGQADQSGALQQIARAPGGVFLLWVLFAGLLALGLWQLLQVVLERKASDEHPWAHRVGSVGKAVAFLAVAFTAFTFARGGHSNSSSSSKTASAKILEAPGGELLLIVVGLVVVGIGVFFAFRGVAVRFRNDLEPTPGPVLVTATVLGAVGYVAKGVALVVVGILFVVAAWTFDPKKATGLDGALLALARLPSGSIILLCVGIGLICYGLYCGVRARYGKL